MQENLTRCGKVKSTITLNNDISGEDISVSLNPTSNLNEWDKLYSDRFNITYNSKDKLSTIVITGGGGWEILSIPISTTVGQTYTFSCDFLNITGYNALSSDYGGIGMQALTRIEDGPCLTDNAIATTYLPTKQNASTTRHSITFTATNTITQIAFNLGMCRDSEQFSVALGNFELTDGWAYYRDGKAKTVTTTVIDTNRNVTLVEGTDYNVSYSNNINIGTAQVTITGIQDYTNTRTELFSIASNPCNVTFDNNFLSGDVYGNRSVNPTLYYTSGTTTSSQTFTEDASTKIGAVMQFKMNSGSTNGIHCPPPSRLTVGTTYTWSVYVRTSSNKTLVVGHEQGGTKTVNVTTSWQRITGTFTATDAIYNSFIFYLTGGSVWNSGDILYVHSLELTQKSSLNVSSTVKEYNATLGTLPTPTRTGYTFTGWYTAPVGGSQISSSTVVTNRVTYYAHWTCNKYYLDLNGLLDGSASGNISGYGTADVTINGVNKGNDIADFYQQIYYGSSYSISDIRTASGKEYNGISSGSASGTMGTSNIAVQLKYTSLTTVRVYGTSNDSRGMLREIGIYFKDQTGTPSWTMSGTGGFSIGSTGSSSGSASWSAYRTFSRPASNSYIDMYFTCHQKITVLFVGLFYERGNEKVDNNQTHAGVTVNW